MRMGQEKGLIVLAGKCLVQHVMTTAMEVADECIVSVARNKSEAYRNVLGEGSTIVEDSRSNIGPLEGLVSSFKRARGEYVLVSPCDTPFLRIGVCRLVVSRALGNDAAVPVVNGYFEPLHGVYEKEKCLKAFEKTLQEGRFKAIDAFSELGLVRVEEVLLRQVDPNLESFWNLNRPEDIRTAEERNLDKTD